jgi:16S rRNA processing protein RimM
MPNQLPNQNKRQAKGVPSQTYMHRNRQVSVPDGYMAVGMVASVHGLRGEVKVELHTDFPERFAPGEMVYLGANLQETVIVEARPHQGHYLLKFRGIGSREQAEDLRGLWIFIPETDAADLEEDTYFVHDIIGLSVQTVSGKLLGTVDQVLFTGANEVYIVKTADEPPRELLLPAIAEVIKQVDLENGILVVEPLPGLLDE